MTLYRHTQPGTLVLLLVSPLALLALSWVLAYRTTPGAIIAVVVLFLCVGIFPSLSVDVSKTSIRVWFGAGFIRKTIPISSIRVARIVRNRWYYGWGIRLVPGGWMFNISGLGAVELERVDGGNFRIGTNEPDALLRAIRKARGEDR